MKKRIVATSLLSLALIQASFALTPSPGQQLLELHNQTRDKRHKCDHKKPETAVRLKWEPRLAKAAQQHAKQMAKRNKLSHKLNGGPKKRLKRVKYRWQRYAENIAFGFDNPESVYKSWLNSKKHCQNIVNPGFTELGAGEHNGYWVVIFAKPAD